MFAPHKISVLSGATPALPVLMALVMGVMVSLFTGAPLYGLAIGGLVLLGAAVGWLLRRPGRS